MKEVEENGIDPELVDDRDEEELEDVEPVDMPDYDSTQFELSEDFEFSEEGEDNGG